LGASLLAKIIYEDKVKFKFVLKKALLWKNIFQYDNGGNVVSYGLFGKLKENKQLKDIIH